MNKSNILKENADIKILEGSMAVALTVKTCKPNIVSAYPITPQTHIVEDIAQMVTDGEMPADYIKVDSEFSALSTLIGASATGARTYSSTTSQGLALMFEVLFNASGMRLPIVMTVVNRALSAPLSIWNDQQDSISVRDAGWIQLYAEDNQEACDLLPIAYRVAEDKEVLLPTMCCMDGYVLTHTFEPVVIPDESLVDDFLPPFKPDFVLDPKNPVTFGAYAGPEIYTEFRYQQHNAMIKAEEKIKKAMEEFGEMFGRDYYLIDDYRLDDADIVLISMGSLLGTMKDVVDEMREEGTKVGILKITSYRPFPRKEIYEKLKGIEKGVVFEKDVSIGMGAGLFNDLKAALYGKKQVPSLYGFAAGLGGRDITINNIKDAVKTVKTLELEDFASDLEDFGFINLRREVL